MFRWLGDALASSIGKKVLMALTGLALVGFLVEHLYGNLYLYEGHEAFDGYVEHLKSWGWLLTVAEFGLLALFACHIYLGIRVSMENREARSQGYVVRNSRGASSVASISMLATGLVLLGFLVKHVIDFRFNEEFHESPASTVRETLGQPMHALVYLAAVLALTFHLSHAIQSACQTLGLSHPKFTPLIRKGSVAIAVLFGIGFGSFPIILWLGGGSH